jgi:hypothetical protein
LGDLDDGARRVFGEDRGRLNPKRAHQALDLPSFMRPFGQGVPNSTSMGSASREVADDPSALKISIRGTNHRIDRSRKMRQTRVVEIA